MGPEIVVPVATFSAIVAIIWVVQAYVSRNRRAFYETVRAAIERGTELSPETIKTLGAPRSGKYSDIKWGMIWVGVALGCLVCGAVFPSDPDDFQTFNIFAGIAAFPGFVGLALLGYGIAMVKVKE